MLDESWLTPSPESQGEDPWLLPQSTSPQRPTAPLLRPANPAPVTAPLLRPAEPFANASPAQPSPLQDDLFAPPFFAPSEKNGASAPFSPALPRQNAPPQPPSTAPHQRPVALSDLHQSAPPQPPSTAPHQRPALSSQGAALSLASPPPLSLPQSIAPGGEVLLSPAAQRRTPKHNEAPPATAAFNRDDALFSVTPPPPSLSASLLSQQSPQPSLGAANAPSAASSSALPASSSRPPSQETPFAPSGTGSRPRSPSGSLNPDDQRIAEAAIAEHQRRSPTHAGEKAKNAKRSGKNRAIRWFFLSFFWVLFVGGLGGIFFTKTGSLWRKQFLAMLSTPEKNPPPQEQHPQEQRPREEPSRPTPTKRRIVRPRSRSVEPRRHPPVRATLLSPPLRREELPVQPPRRKDNQTLSLPADLKAMIRIPKGWFVYGGVGSALSLRWKRLPTYWIDRTEVTQAAYRECVQAGACVSVVSSQRASFDLPQQPVTMVNWHEAAAYCRFRQKRLPSSEEWEKAARGIDGQIFAFRSTLPSCRHAVYGRPLQPPFACPMHPEGPMPVASKPLDRSPFGVMDMSGNVSEWINDCAQKRADGACLERFARGGNWHSHAAELLAARRWASPPQTRQWDLGFRCAWP